MNRNIGKVSRDVSPQPAAESKLFFAAWAVAGAAILATVLAVGARQAKAELVYEDELQSPPAAAAPAAEPRVEERSSLRQAIQSSEKAQATVQSQQYQQTPATQYVAAPAPAAQTVVVEQRASQAIPVGSPAEIENVSKAELIRRERVRTELKNEDILQERLEQLRIRDEQRRTDGLLATTPALQQQQQVAASPAPVVAQPVATEVVAPTAPAPAPSASPAPAAAAAAPAVERVYSADEPATSSRANLDVSLPSDEERTRIQVMPRGGMSSMKVDSNYEVNARYSMGLGLGAEVSDNVGFELGYTYSEYGIALASTNPLAQNPANFGFAPRSGFENYALKQNVFDLGIKLYLLGQQSKFRPFIGGGGAYSKGYVNYDQSLLNQQRAAGLQGVSDDYEISSFLGMVSTGFDLKLSKSISIGGVFKYYGVLSSRENSSLNDQALYYGTQYPGYGYPGYGYPAYAAQGPNAEKAALGTSLAQSGFYTVLLGATFTF